MIIIGYICVSVLVMRICEGWNKTAPERKRVELSLVGVVWPILILYGLQHFFFAFGKFLGTNTHDDAK